MIQAAPTTVSRGLDRNPRPTAQDTFRRAINESATSRTMAQTTGGIARRIREARQMRDPQRRAVRIEEIEYNLERQWRAGRFSILEQFDYDQFFHDLYDGRRGVPAWQDMQRVLMPQSDQARNASVQETVLQVMTADQFANMLTTTIRFGMIERCEIAPMTLLSLVNRNPRLSPGTTKTPKFRTSADVVQDQVPELGETEFFSIPTPNMITLPEAMKKKFAIGYTREMLGVDPNGFLRREIDRMAEAMDLHIEKLLADMMFGLYDTTLAGGNPFPYIEDDIMWHTYLAAGGGGPWQNDLTGNALDGTYQPFEAVELLIEKQRDPYSGEPVVCNSDPKVVVTNRTSMQLAMDGLGVVQIGRDISGPGNPRIAIERPSGRFDVSEGDIQYSAHIFDRLKAWFQTAAGGALTETAAEAAAHDTWLYGDTMRAFAFATEWDRERLTRVGTNTWQYFNQEVIFSAKWLEKTTPAVMDPMMVYRNRP